MKNMKKEDLRVIKTKRLIESNFIELVKTIGYQKITVKDLCEKAMINRNTFYLHYKDKDDLVKEMINKVFLKYEAQLKPLGEKFYKSVIFNNKHNFEENIKEFLNIIYEDINLYRILLMDNYLSEYFKTFEKAYEKLILKTIIIRNKRAMQTFKYFIGGTTGVLIDWILSDSSLEDTANILSKLIFNTVKQFIKENRK